MPRGRGIPRNEQLRACRLWEANWSLPDWHHPDDRTSLQDLADQFGVAKATIHRWVSRDVLSNDRRRSQLRRDQIKRGTRKP